jgi:L-phenylalanine/L-methionine N-acetyltransferase
LERCHTERTTARWAGDGEESVVDDEPGGAASQTPTDVVIRPVRAEDVEAINAIRRQPAVVAFTLAIPSERIVDNQRFVDGLGPDDHVLVAEIDGRARGLAALHVKRGKLRHSAEIGIAVHDGFQGRGLGRLLLAALLDLADNHLGLVRVELEVLADNARAIALYERFGFEHEGRKRKAVYRRGQYEDLLVMSRLRGAAYG